MYYSDGKKVEQLFAPILYRFKNQSDDGYAMKFIYRELVKTNIEDNCACGVHSSTFDSETLRCDGRHPTFFLYGHFSRWEYICKKFIYSLYFSYRCDGRRVSPSNPTNSTKNTKQNWNEYIRQMRESSLSNLRFSKKKQKMIGAWSTHKRIVERYKAKWVIKSTFYDFDLQQMCRLSSMFVIENLINHCWRGLWHFICIFQCEMRTLIEINHKIAREFPCGHNVCQFSTCFEYSLLRFQ